jgi:hypothetical protein
MNDLTEEIKLEIVKLYNEMLTTYFPIRGQKCLNDNHKRLFVQGIWNSIIQSREKGITKNVFYVENEDVDNENEDNNKKDRDEEKGRRTDIFSDIVDMNVLFFLDNLKGEEVLLAEEKYFSFIIKYL